MGAAAEHLSDLFLVKEVAPRVLGLLFAESAGVSVLACRTLRSIFQSLFFLPTAHRRFAIDTVYPALVDLSKADANSALLITLAELLPDIQAILQLHGIVTTFAANEEKESILRDIERDGEITAGFVSEIITSLFERRDANITTSLLTQFSRLAGSLGTHVTLPIARTHITPIVYTQVL